MPFPCAHCTGNGRGICARPNHFCANCCRWTALTDGFVCTHHPPVQSAPHQPYSLRSQPAGGANGQPQGALAGGQPQQQAVNQQQVGNQQPANNQQAGGQQQQQAVNSPPPGAVQQQQQPGASQQMQSVQQFLQSLQAQGLAVPPHLMAAPQQQLPPPPGSPAPQPLQGAPGSLASHPQQGQVNSEPAQPPHLLAFGPQPNGWSAASLLQAAANPAHSVPSTSHSHNTFNSHNTNFFTSMSDGLVPAIAGQGGPSLEHLLGRSIKNWKPYSNAAEFVEALEDWQSEQISLHHGNPALCKAFVAYVARTSKYIELVGLTHAYAYHKAAFKAASKDPPLYRPLSDGPMYLQAYIEHIQPYLQQAKAGFNKRAPAGGSALKQRSSAKRSSGEKRDRSSETCSIHTNGTHTNGECRSQSSKKQKADKDD